MLLQLIAKQLYLLPSRIYTKKVNPANIIVGSTATDNKAGVSSTSDTALVVPSFWGRKKLCFLSSSLHACPDVASPEILSCNVQWGFLCTLLWLQAANLKVVITTLDFIQQSGVRPACKMGAGLICMNVACLQMMAAFKTRPDWSFQPPYITFSVLTVWKAPVRWSFQAAGSILYTTLPSVVKSVKWLHWLHYRPVGRRGLEGVCPTPLPLSPTHPPFGLQKIFFTPPSYI